jgi:putative ABC transport system permease protein
MHNIFSMFRVVFKRLIHNLGLSLSALVGIVAILSLVVCVPIFSHAVSSKLLSQQLEEKAGSSHRRLFSFHYYYVEPTRTSRLDFAKIKTFTNYLKTRGEELVGLPIEQIVWDVQSSGVNLVPIVADAVDPTFSLKALKFLSLDILPEYAQIAEGRWPEPVTDPNAPVEVAVSLSLADEAFINLGDRFSAGSYEFVVVGMWQEYNNQDPIWFSNPDIEYGNKMWVPQETYEARIMPMLNKPIFYVSWYIIFDDSQLKYQRAPQYAKGIVRLDSELRGLISDISSDFSPLKELKEYETRASTLNTIFYAVGSPMIILALIFISLTATIAIQQYEQETATMRGRGTSWLQVVNLNLIESFLLILVAVPLSLVGGWFASGIITRTLSFLQFTDRTVYPFSYAGLNYLLLGISCVLIIFARFSPMLGLSRTTIVRMKQEQSRGAKKPFWQRFYLDFILLIPGIYAYMIMRGWAKPSGLLSRLAATGEQYRDPLLFVAPAIFAMAVCMILVRLVPLLVKLLAAIVERMPGVWAFLSLQQIARRPQDHSSAQLLIMLSLSLAIYSASTAKTLDQWLSDSVYYRVGSDVAIKEYIVEGGGSSAFGEPGSGPSTTSLIELDAYNAGYVSLEEHLALPSIDSATRVGKYKGTFSFGVGEMSCTYMGIERLNFPQTAFYREDFSKESLGAMMNAMALEPAGVLIPSQLVEEFGFEIGDLMTMSLNVKGQKFVHDLVVVGIYDFFPTVYPADPTTLIVNLDYIFENEEAITGYEIWLNLRENADVKYLLEQIRRLIGVDRAVVEVEGNAMEEVKSGIDEPERIGMFGILNVGFIMTGLMPGIGFVLYSYSALRRRFVQLGILQALGLSVRQLIAYLVSEQSLLMGIAILGGAAIGLLTSYLYLPFLQIGATPGASVPPFYVQIGWWEAFGLSVTFGVILFLTMAGTITYLVRLKVSQAVKLGEAL